MVNDAMMARFEGRYDVLYTQLKGKYGEPGFPKEETANDEAQATTSSRPSSGAASGGGGGGSAAGPPRSSGKELGDFHDQFVSLIGKAQSQVPSSPIVAAGSGSSGAAREQSLDTSTFTVCLRVRPLLGDELTSRGESFNCVIPGAVNVLANSDRTEEAIIFTPKVGITGKPSIASTSFTYDHVFGPTRDGTDVYDSVGSGLVSRALAGQVGVVFAFGQTGSGKTHTMNGLMDKLSEQLYADSSETSKRRITFSYMEILGTDIKDCLIADKDTNPKVQIGELLDGRAMVKNLSVHQATSDSALSALVEVAKSHRRTKTTDKNNTSSRSHGVGIIKVGHMGYEPGMGPAEGVLYIIDLAGSERADDSKGHSKERMDETKEINLSLMSLKECIRARTMASGPGGASIHVPYRRSKLTLLMKDVFDIGCARMCSTVVLAHVSPLASDVKHTTNTVNYSAPLRVAVNDKKRMEKDKDDPANWGPEQIRSWCVGTAALDKDEEKALLPSGTTGMDLCQASEVEIYRRLPGVPEKAKAVYQGLWTMICDAKVRKRRPDGTIITAEQEAAEIEEAKRLQEEKIKLWAEREKHMRSEH